METKLNHAGVVWTTQADAIATELAPGIRRRVLWTQPGGARAQLLEIDPGARFNSIDVHDPGSEEIYVLSGVFNDGIRDYPAGTFIHNPAGSSHIPQSATGCVLFVFFPEG